MCLVHGACKALIGLMVCSPSALRPASWLHAARSLNAIWRSERWRSPYFFRLFSGCHAVGPPADPCPTAAFAPPPRPWSQFRGCPQLYVRGASLAQCWKATHWRWPCSVTGGRRRSLGRGHPRCRAALIGSCSPRRPGVCRLRLAATGGSGSPCMPASGGGSRRGGRRNCLSGSLCPPLRRPK